GRSRRLRESGCRLLPVGSDKGAHALGLLRALGHPVVDACEIELQLRLAAPRDRVEKSDVLEAQAALALAAVRHHYVIEGLIPRPAPRQANGYHDRSALVRYGRLTGTS